MRRNGDTWKCSHCDHADSSPISGRCPGCGCLGHRYPVTTAERRDDPPNNARDTTLGDFA